MVENLCLTKGFTQVGLSAMANQLWSFKSTSVIWLSANRVFSGQANSRNNPSPPCVKPRPLYATLKRHPIHLQATEYLIQSLSWATAHCSTFARYTKPRHKANLAKELQLPTHGNQSLVRQITAGF
ncbi:MAG: hypothetical protein CUR34_11500 [Sediminibacterium sp.]|nr:MAG: hypothetical protein CUR34_11500 [Sediminibacterium sp.] [Sediminibacterium sp. FEMGT703S]